MNISLAVMGILGVFLTIVIATSLGPTVIEQTEYNAFNSSGTNNPAGPLENASGTGKTMYSLVELMFPIMVVIFLITAGFGLSHRV